MTLLHLLGLLIPYLKLGVPVVDDVTAYPGDTHLSPLSHPVNELSEQAACRMFEIPQVDFDQQVHVPLIHHLRKRVIEPGVLLYLPSLFV